MLALPNCLVSIFCIPFNVIPSYFPPRNYLGFLKVTCFKQKPRTLQFWKCQNRRVTALKLFAKWKINWNYCLHVKMTNWCFTRSRHQTITNDISITAQWAASTHPTLLLREVSCQKQNLCWDILWISLPRKSEVSLPAPCNL